MSDAIEYYTPREGQKWNPRPHVNRIGFIIARIIASISFVTALTCLCLAGFVEWVFYQVDTRQISGDESLIAIPALLAIIAGMIVGEISGLAGLVATWKFDRLGRFMSIFGALIPVLFLIAWGILYELKL